MSPVSSRSARSPEPPAVVAELARLGEVLSSRLDLLVDRVTKAIKSEIDYYSSSGTVTSELTASVVRANLNDVISGIVGDEDFVTESARRTGASRAELGVPLPALMHAYRIAFQDLWRELRTIAEADRSFSRHAVLAATERVWNAYDTFTREVADAHRAHTTEQILDDAAERAALTEHLLEGRIASRTTLWEIAALLRLPTRGPYMVVAAATDGIGKQPLPTIESQLRGLDVYSAWRLLPGEQIGLVHVPTAEHRRQTLNLFARLTPGRIGVSALFDDLLETASALKFARLARHAPGSGVTEFDGSVLGIAAVSTPEVSTGLAKSVLHNLYALPEEDRKPLFETFRAWVNADGNVNATAEELFVHRNTIRHRLRRIEELTLRSTSSPREVAELCLAFEVDARLAVNKE
ncbi:PucR family transcriptional regulator [Gordonia sp. (in: high G+C Gram-positive bacteria)]|uniref:PucR family transcriptional regulator n=1 Tax=Gordonia sp. (in: high G+C Gram-positive bacteria) TaxID=84139 RepID=UPI003C793525